MSKIRERDPEAVTDIWNAYHKMLSSLADRQLAPGLHRTVDGEDIALSVMRSIYRRAESGELTGITDRDELWALMLTLLYHKAADHGRKHRAAKRGGGTVRGDSVFLATTTESDRLAFAQIPIDELAPDLVVELEDERLRLFGQLDDDQQREIARRRLEGDSPQEIAEALNISPRTVRRKLELIRISWSNSAEFPSARPGRNCRST